LLIHGTVSNGHDFIEKAIQLGAKAIVLSHFASELVIRSYVYSGSR
jgi:UDP-N-acetylmuramyl pentapeptide synthase